MNIDLQNITSKMFFYEEFNQISHTFLKVRLVLFSEGHIGMRLQVQ